MYLKSFGLREAPFNNTPNPRFFFSTPEHDEALACLVYVVRESKGLALLTGEAGTGKTLVSRMLVSHFGGGATFATINQGCSSPTDLLEAVCAEFGVEVESGSGRGTIMKALQEFLVNEYAANRSVVLIVDEAQNLSVKCFEQIRMIGNLDAEEAKLLHVILLGQPELHSIIRSPKLRQFRQRVFRGFHLKALTPRQTADYIRHRLTVAGAANESLFDADAIHAIHTFSGGLPRMINTACDNALLSAYAEGHATLDGPFVEEVMAQILPDAAAPSTVVAERAAIRPHPRRASSLAPERTGFSRSAPRARMGVNRSGPGVRESRDASKGNEPSLDAVPKDMIDEFDRLALNGARLDKIEDRLHRLSTDMIRGDRAQRSTSPRPTHQRTSMQARDPREARSLLKMTSLVRGVIQHLRLLSDRMDSREPLSPSPRAGVRGSLSATLRTEGDLGPQILREASADREDVLASTELNDPCPQDETVDPRAFLTHSLDPTGLSGFDDLALLSASAVVGLDASPSLASPVAASPGYDRLFELESTLDASVEPIAETPRKVVEPALRRTALDVDDSPLLGSLRGLLDLIQAGTSDHLVACL